MSSSAARILRGHDGVERAARAGLVGKGALYAVLGLLATNVALHGGGSDEASQSGAISAVAQQPFGLVLLGALAVGLTSYALWRLAQVVIGPVGTSELPEIVLRAAFLLRGLGYGALAALAWRTLLDGGGGGGGDREQEWTAQLLQLPFGVPLVVAIGLGIAGVGLYQAKKAFDRDFLGVVETVAMSRRERRWFERAGVTGHLARGVVYLLVGGFLVRAALQFGPDDGVGLGAALQELAAAPYGTAMLLVVAFGLVAYGAFCLAMGRYARVHEVD